MNEEYSAYLNSEAWQKKRMVRLAIAKFRCAACLNNKAVHVHHLTYERIFAEEMADLMPLCELHHRAAEELIRQNKLTRKGEPLFLATETLRLLLARSPNRKPRQPRRMRPLSMAYGIRPRNPFQTALLSDHQFLALCEMKDRNAFKKQYKPIAFSKPCPSRVWANAITLYDKIKKRRRKFRR